MRRSALLTAAAALDAFAGDPEWFPHPVRLIGLAISRGETALRRPGQSPRTEFLAGFLLTASVVGSAFLAPKLLLQAAATRSRALADSLEVLLAWTCLAHRNLQDEAKAVLRPLEATDLTQARKRLARIVGRDTATLSPSEISRALIETLAESESDGVLAPLFFLALGGVPLALAYKAVNTLDSMIGHADERYLYFGKAAARLDDLANLLPARVTALALIASAALLPGEDPTSALQTWRRDAHLHKSPNAGQPESAIAGALNVRLGGTNTYAGEPAQAPIMGREFPPPTALHARRALRLCFAASLLGLLAGTALHAALERSRA